MKIECPLKLIYSDYRRYRSATGGEKENRISPILFSQGLWASSVYRLSHFTSQIKPHFVGRIFRIFFLLIEKIVEITTGIRIPGECEIGKGLYIGHFGPIILNSQAKLGENCNLSHTVTIGIVQTGDRMGVPVIGDRVYIGPHSVIIGGITVGDDAVIGAGSVVIHDIPEKGVVAGNPARIISLEGSVGLVNFEDAKSCLDRRRSLDSRKS